MKLDNLIHQRFNDLQQKAAQVESTGHFVDEIYHIVNYEIYYQWAVSVLHLFETLFGEKSSYYQNFNVHHTGYAGDFSHFEICRGILSSAQEDYESGYLFTVRGLIKAEDTTDILEQASVLLESNYKDPACVLAGVALEIVLKELCNRNGIALGKLDSMNVELCKKSVYNMGMQKQITTWAHWRNKAAHGEWSEYKDKDVEDMIRGVTRFIADYL